MNSPALRLAVLDDVLASQLEASPREGDGLEVVWRGSDLEELIALGSSVAPDVIIANLEQLGADMTATTDRAVAATGAQLFFVVYSFARRDRLADISRDRVRAVRAPVNVGMLKVQMMSVLIRGILQPSPSEPEASKVPPSARALRRGGSPLVRQGATPKAVREPLFSGDQLGRLQEISSAVQCECPNHVAALLVSLSAFERYSKDCLNRDDKDAAVHRMLYERTADARTVMEEALADLLKHEGIAI